MTASRLALLDDLIRDTRLTLERLVAGEAPDLEALAADRQRALDALASAEDPPGANDEGLRLRLERLAELNGQLSQAVAALRDGMQDRLRSLERGRRGLAGYHSANRSRRAGPGLGRG